MSAENGDPLAQSVEHHTFNVGVLGSNPKRITSELSSYIQCSCFFVYTVLVLSLHLFKPVFKPRWQKGAEIRPLPPPSRGSRKAMGKRNKR